MLIFALTSTTYVNPGHVGIIIHRSGVDATPYGPGLHMRNPLTTRIQEYPTFMQTLVLTRDRPKAPSTTMRSTSTASRGSRSRSMSRCLDVFGLDPRMVPSLYSTFRPDVMTIEHTRVKQAIRQALQEIVATRR